MNEKKIIISESQVKLLIKNIISEQQQSDPKVVKVQTALKNAGEKYAKLLGVSGPNKDGIDGIFGKNTKDAVIQYQIDNKITPAVGVVGPITAGKLKVEPLSTGGTKTTQGKAVGTSGSSKTPVSKVPVGKEKPTEDSGFSVTHFLRKKFPNIAQMFFTRPLSGNDFTIDQKRVMYDVIKNAISRGGKNNKQRGCTDYKDYSPEIAAKLDTKQGSSTMDMVKGSLFDDQYKVATTLGRFCYGLQKNNMYLITDKYDFSKSSAYTVKPSEVQGMSYPEKFAYIKQKTNLSPYRVLRHIAYLEHPDSAPDNTKTPITVVINPAELA